MTRRQIKLNKRNEEIKKYYKEHSFEYGIEDMAATFKMSVPSIYRILRYEN